MKTNGHFKSGSLPEYNKKQIFPVFFGKFFYIMLTIVLFIISLNSVKGQNSDFRKTKWGMSYKQVEVTEIPKTVIISENRLIYNDTIAGSPFSLVYTFNEKSELVSAEYILDKTYIDHNFYINEYYKFKELLIKKYGIPKKDEQNWLVDVKDKDTTNWANALELGYLNLFSSWETSKSNINLLVTKYDKVHLFIDYKAKNTQGIDISKYSTDDL
jgi:hypothetical protein